MTEAALRAVMLATLVAAAPASAGEVYGDGRDPWTLFDYKLVNRELPGQLEDEPFRLGRDLGPLSVAADLSVGAQVRTAKSPQSRFHGYFLADVFTSLRLAGWLDANLNVTFTNPSASDGYRLSSFVLPGLSIHVHPELPAIFGEPVRLDFLASDLDLVTLGRGLLLEQVPLEGYRGGLGWRGFELSTVFGGQLYFENDDFEAYLFTALNGRLGAQLTHWSVQSTPDPAAPGKSNYYLGLFGELPLRSDLRVAAEAQARLDRGVPRFAALLRGDFLSRELGRWQVHGGWQVRYYARHFTPQEFELRPATSPSLPYREDAYVTNTFEYLDLSRYYDQWSHTAMLEARLRLIANVSAVTELEGWLRFVADPGALPRVVYSDGTRIPGVIPGITYRAGLEYRVERPVAFRVLAAVTNKTVNSAFWIVQPVEQRFSRAPLLLLRLEASP
ncbi:MAG: hypothetical protein ACYC8T_03980 [Myxococcaceae bacterium]